MVGISVKRQLRAEREMTGGAAAKGIADRNCVHQKIDDVGVWPSGQVKQRLRYLHVTKGWRNHVLPPLQYRNA